MYGKGKWEGKNKREDIKRKTQKCACDYQQYETIRSFADNIYTDKSNIDEAEMNRSKLLKIE